MPARKQFRFRRALEKDAAALAELHTAVAQHLTETHGKGPWTSKTTEKGVLFAIRNAHVVVAEEVGKIIATWRLATRKPWAIDPAYFTKCGKPVYLLAMAVAPKRQRRGIGCRCLHEAKRIARSMKADAIRLDAFDADGGAGRFYERCGYTERGRTAYRNTPLIYYEMLLGDHTDDR
jgi:ribosomal protein S18 acetylase RimI-like enzyme